MEFGDLFSFDKKIAPAIIKPIYWVGLVLIVLGGIISFFAGFFGLFSHFFAGLWTMVASVVWVVFGVLGLRIGAEICLAVFEIHERTTGGSNPQS
jgi:drug/metabolite transporter (DMT)-like permease